MHDLISPDWNGPLTSEEEAELVHRMRAGDLRARDLLIESQLPWLKVISKKYTCRHFPLPDLFQHTVIELLNCLETFDPRVARLTTYLARPIRWRLFRLVKCCRLIHLPYVAQPKYVEQHAQARQMQAFTEGAEHRIPDGRHAPDEILAEAEEQEHIRGRLHDALAKISNPRQQRILRCRLAGQTLAQIGRSEQLTRERIRQIEADALDQLRELLEAA